MLSSPTVVRRPAPAPSATLLLPAVRLPSASLPTAVSEEPVAALIRA